MKFFKKRVNYSKLQEGAPFCVYLIECQSKGHYYHGMTDNLARIMKEHHKGNVEFTKKHGISEVRVRARFDEREKARRHLLTMHKFLIRAHGEDKINPIPKMIYILGQGWVFVKEQ